MLVHGEVPDVLGGVVEGLFKGTVGRLMESVDVGEVFFRDWNRGVEFEIAAAGASGLGGRYDVLRKSMVEGGKGLKRCRRCGSCTEDVPVNEVRYAPPWIMLGTRFCVCSGHWTVV